VTNRLGGPLVGALVGLAAAALGAVFLTGGGFDARVLAIAAGSVLVTAVVAFIAGKSIAPAAPALQAPAFAPASGTGAVSGAIPVGQLQESARAAQNTADRTVLVETCIWMRDRGPADEGIIARTEQIGYTDRGRIVRHPIVTVYRGQGVRA
jgi:hypothetical protein